MTPKDRPTLSYRAGVTGPADSLTRRAVLSAILGATAVALLGCEPAAPLDEPAAPLDLDGTVDDLVGRLDRHGPYRHPTPAERDRAIAAVDRLLAGDTTAATAELLAPLDMDLTTSTDPATGRRCALAASRPRTDRSWGLLAVDLTGLPPGVVVEVPHPGSDRLTEQLGLALFRALPHSALLIAGAHRDAAGGTADVAHQTESMFHALAVHLADRGAAQLQLHGFDDDSLTEHEIVISAGAGVPDRRIEQAAAAIAAAGFDVCSTWTQRCGSLEGRTNVQGRAAAARGQPFLHLEVNRSTRDDPDRRAAITSALASTYRSP